MKDVKMVCRIENDNQFYWKKWDFWYLKILGLKKNMELRLFLKKTKIRKIIWRKGFGKLFSKIKYDEMGDGTWRKGGHA